MINMTLEDAIRINIEGNLNHADKLALQLCDELSLLGLINKNFDKIFELIKNQYYQIMQHRFICRVKNVECDWSGCFFYTKKEAIGALNDWIEELTNCAYIIDIMLKTIHVPKKFEQQFSIEDMPIIDKNIIENFNKKPIILFWDSYSTL